MKFKFCPKCGRRGTSAGGERHLCRACEHEFYFNPAPAVSVIVENRKGEIMLVRRARAPQKWYWDFPGGFVDPGESVESAVQREIAEELGVQVRAITYLQSYPGRYLYKDVNYYTLNLIIAAEIASGKIVPADDVSGVQFFSRDKIPWKRLAFPYMIQVIKECIKHS